MVSWGLPPTGEAIPSCIQSAPVLETSLCSAAHGWSLWDPSPTTAGGRGKQGRERVAEWFGESWRGHCIGGIVPTPQELPSGKTSQQAL